MERLECPNCQLQAVERRASNLPRYVKLRKVDGLHDQYVCRNVECQWTGGVEDLAETEQTGPDYEHRPATDWAEKQTDGGTMQKQDQQKHIEVSPSRGFHGNDEVVELQTEEAFLMDEWNPAKPETHEMILPMNREQAERVRDEIDAALEVLADD